MQTHAHRAASQECSYFPSKLPSVEGAGRICNTDSKCQAALLHCHWNKCYRTVLDSRSTQLLMRKKSNELNSVVSIPVFMSLFLFFWLQSAPGVLVSGKDWHAISWTLFFICLWLFSFGCYSKCAVKQNRFVYYSPNLGQDAGKTLLTATGHTHQAR